MLPINSIMVLMRKRIINGLMVLLILVMIALVALIGFSFTTLGRELQIGSSYNQSNPPNYRFMVILDGADSDFVEDMIVGMEKASEDYSVVYELWAFAGSDRQEQILRQLDVGVESQVDGILVQAFDDSRFKDLLIKAKRLDVPIITLGEDVPSQEKASFVSYNKYQMGSRIGSMLSDLLAQEGHSGGTIAIIQNSPLFDQDQAFAIQEELPDGFIVKPVKVMTESERLLNAEGLARATIEENRDLSAFICLSSQETLGTIQALKDTNKIGDVVVIGSGDSLDVTDYIERGILAATIVPDVENIGYEALFDLTKYNDGLFVSQYRDISVEIIDREGLEDYLDRKGGLQ